MGDIKSFEDLDCWKKGTALRREVSKVIRLYPENEKYELVSQMRRASSSIPANIAEGCGRESDAEFKRFLIISRSSASELEYFCK